MSLKFIKTNFEIKEKLMQPTTTQQQLEKNTRLQKTATETN